MIAMIESYITWQHPLQENLDLGVDYTCDIDVTFYTHFYARHAFPFSKHGKINNNLA